MENKSFYMESQFLLSGKKEESKIGKVMSPTNDRPINELVDHIWLIFVSQGTSYIQENMYVKKDAN